MSSVTKYLRQMRNGYWYYYRRVPEYASEIDKRRHVYVSTKTKSLHVAIPVAEKLNEETETLWRALQIGKGEGSAQMQYDRAVRHARLLGVQYKSAEQIANGPLDEIIQRLQILEQRNLKGVETAVAAVMGGVEQPEFELENIVEHYFEMNKDLLLNKAPDQIRKWKNPKIKAFRNLISVIGNKPINSISRNDALDFRTWWLNRVIDEEMDIGTANKDIGAINKIINDIDKKYRLNLNKPFAETRLHGEIKGKRPAFSSEFVQNRILARGVFNDLNPTARHLVYLMAFTGMRPSEIVNLDKNEDIVLDHEYPHVIIRAGKRQLKTRHSERKIPVVGMAYEALSLQKSEGFDRYRNNPDSVTALINKYFRNHDLLPTDDHSLYSLRHTFKDRLIEAECPARIQKELMGHKIFDEPEYGDGAALKQRTKWIERVAYQGTIL